MGAEGPGAPPGPGGETEAWPSVGNQTSFNCISQCEYYELLDVTGALELPWAPQLGGQEDPILPGSHCQELYIPQRVVQGSEKKKKNLKRGGIRFKR